MSAIEPVLPQNSPVIKNIIRAWMVDNKSTNWSIETEEDMERVFEEINNDNKRNNSQKDQEANEQEEVPILGQQIDVQDQNNISNSPEMPPEVRVKPVIILDIIHKSDNEEEEISAASKEILTSKSLYQVSNESIISKKFDTLTNINDIPITIEEIKNMVCYICNKEASGPHTCMKCKQMVHTICGVVSEENEGYGSQLLCNLCLNERNIVQN